MAAQIQQETMQRKPILMPAGMISKVDKIARDRRVSFAEVVRAAVDAFDGDASIEDEALLETLADTLIVTTRAVVQRLDATCARLDETHIELRERR
jgi:hypothetical protein